MTLQQAEDQGVRKCVYCKKELPKRKKKYCSDLCRYRYLSIKNHKPTKFKIAQHLRMARAGAKQRAGKIGVRYI